MLAGFLKFGGMNVVVNDGCFEAFHVFGHLHHQFWPLKLGMAAWPVFNFSRGGELASDLDSRD
jgi:hypothetical protein